LPRWQQRAEFVGRQAAERRTAGQNFQDVTPIEHGHAGDRSIGQRRELGFVQVGAEIGDDRVDSNRTIARLVEIEPSAGRQLRHRPDQ
jgi:hypothetical protein